MEIYNKQIRKLKRISKSIIPKPTIELLNNYSYYYSIIWYYYSQGIIRSIYNENKIIVIYGKLKTQRITYFGNYPEINNPPNNEFIEAYNFSLSAQQYKFSNKYDPYIYRWLLFVLKNSNHELPIKVYTEFYKLEIRQYPLIKSNIELIPKHLISEIKLSIL